MKYFCLIARHNMMRLDGTFAAASSLALSLAISGRLVRVP